MIKVIEKGEIVYNLPTLGAIRENALENLAQLPSKCKKLKKTPTYPVKTSTSLKKMMKKLINELKKIEFEDLN